jgi:dTDP-4-dehydrorhamnose 3,5-epimerase
VIFSRTPLDGAWIVDLELRADDRGFFARTFCAREFEAQGIPAGMVQANVSWNHTKGTLRGMHYQVEPATEPKLVRCIRGAIQDVIVDMRPESPTFLQHISVNLSADNRRSLYVPPMFAHGYLTLADDTEVSYQVGEFYTPGYERGLRYDDPTLGISWQASVSVISDKDTAWLLMQGEVGTRELPSSRSGSASGET